MKKLLMGLLVLFSSVNVFAEKKIQITSKVVKINQPVALYIACENEKEIDYDIDYNKNALEVVKQEQNRVIEYKNGEKTDIAKDSYVFIPKEAGEQIIKIIFADEKVVPVTISVQN